MQLALFEFINKTIEEFELNHATYEYVENNLKRILNLKFINVRIMNTLNLQHGN